jgi:hypothetical protein
MVMKPTRDRYHVLWDIVRGGIDPRRNLKVPRVQGQCFDLDPDLHIVSLIDYSKEQFKRTSVDERSSGMGASSLRVIPSRPLR